MSKDYTQFDWASDRLARTRREEDESEMIRGIDRRMRKNKYNHKRTRRQW